MGAVRVLPAIGRSGVESFIRLPFRLYRDDPFWVPALLSDARKAVTTSANAFWLHAERELFLAERDGQTVGRICATVDHNYNRYHASAVGFFGFFESTDDVEVARALFEAAAVWCRERGMRQIYGPANPSMNDEAGTLIGPFDGSPMIKMTYNPPYYPLLIEACGFSKIKDLYAYLVPVKDPPVKMVRVMERLKRRDGIEVRPIDMRNLSRDLGYIKDIYNDAWSNNWDFAPMTDAEIDDLARAMRPIVRPGLCPLVFRNGDPAAMCIALPDYNQLLKRIGGRLLPFGWLTFLVHRNRVDRARLWALGTKRRYQNLGYDALLYYETFLEAQRLGYEFIEVSWILEDNDAIIRPIQMWRGQLYRTYRVYQRPL